MTKNINKLNKGFTIVELLVVIVVIGILAAITIVSYTGITAKANTARSLSNAQSVQNVSDILYAEGNVYPATTGAIEASTTAKLPATVNVVPGTTGAITAENGDDTVGWECAGGTSAEGACAGATGGRISYYDFTESGSVKYLYVGSSSATTADADFFTPAS